jgi:Mrp family chromosome partitioning ATPase
VGIPGDADAVKDGNVDGSRRLSDLFQCHDSSSVVQEKQPGERKQDFLDRQGLKLQLWQIQQKILVLCGKGGVGKSAIAMWRI